MKQPKIKLKNLSKTFKTKRQSIEALKNINVEVYEKEFVTIVGPSGCGKSTIIRLIDDIIKPTSGDIYIDGEKYESKVPKETIRKFGFIFQQPNLLPWLTVRENVKLPINVFKYKDHEKWDEVVDKLLVIGELKEYADMYPGALSGGMVQRVGVLRAMAYQPEILLMDEPFGALDEILREQLDLETLRLWSKLGQTIIFITHNVQEAILVSSRVYVMATNPGRIVAEEAIDLPRPRTLEMKTTPKFIGFEEKITSLIGDIELDKIK